MYKSTLLLLSMFFFCSCGDTTIENADSNLNGSISILVVDAATNSLVEKASVQLLGRDIIPRMPDSKSTVVYEYLPIGKGYAFLAEAVGYASMLCKADISPDSLVVGKDFRLPKLGAKLQGSIAYVDLSTNAINTQTVGYEEAKVRLKLNLSNECELLNPYKEAATGLNGAYFFDSLPELASYDLTALEAKIDDVIYGQFLIQDNGILGLSGDIAKAPLGIYKDAFSIEEFRLLSAPDTVSPDGKISLVFSKDINKSRTNDASFSIIGANYAVETRWNGEKILEIFPIGGLWKTGDIISISNTMDLYAMDGTVINPSNLATVAVTNGALGNVSKFWLENAGTGTSLNVEGDSIELSVLISQQKGLIFRWNKAYNATGYVIYAKCADEINYTQIETNLSFASDTSAVWEYSQVYYCIKQDKQSGFFVQARNSKEHTNSNFISITGYIKED